MCVQDTVSLGVNITAEITKNEVDNFVHMCQLFSEHEPKFDDERMISHVTPTNLARDQTLSSDRNANWIDLIEQEIANCHQPAALQMRHRAELKIISTLTKYIRDYKPSLQLYPYGSTQYGIKLACTNFNVLIVDGESLSLPSMIYIIFTFDLLQIFLPIFCRSSNRSTE